MKLWYDLFVSTKWDWSMYLFDPVVSKQNVFSRNRSTVLFDSIDLIQIVFWDNIRCTVRIDSSKSKYLLTVPVDSLDTISNTFDSIDLIDPNCILGTISKMYGTNRLIWIKIFLPVPVDFFGTVSNIQSYVSITPNYSQGIFEKYMVSINSYWSRCIPTMNTIPTI